MWEFCRVTSWGRTGISGRQMATRSLLSNTGHGRTYKILFNTWSGQMLRFKYSDIRHPEHQLWIPNEFRGARSNRHYNNHVKVDKVSSSIYIGGENIEMGNNCFEMRWGRNWRACPGIGHPPTPTSCPSFDETWVISQFVAVSQGGLQENVPGVKKNNHRCRDTINVTRVFLKVIRKTSWICAQFKFFHIRERMEPGEFML